MKIRPEKNSGLIFTNAQVVFINAKIALSITLLCAVLTLIYSQSCGTVCRYFGRESLGTED